MHSFNGPDDPKSPNYDVNQVVLAQIYLSLDQEEGLMDRMQQQILVPRLGMNMALRNQQERIHDISYEHGTIFEKSKK